MFKRKDFIIIVIITFFIVISLIFNYFFFYQKGAAVKIKINGQEYQTVPLNTDQTIEIENKNTIIIKNNEVYIKDATCPDKLCQKQGHISKNGQQIICLPNQVIVEIISYQNNDIDASTH